MTEHSLSYYPYASFTNTQLPLLRVAALYFDKLVLLDLSRNHEQGNDWSYWHIVQSGSEAS
jgi:hypothetical protein